MFFYNPKENKLVCEIDSDKKSIVAWTDKSLITHIRVYRMEELSSFFDRLPTIYSKIIYDPVKDVSWVQYEGSQGMTCQDLEDHIKSFNWSEEEEYAVVYKRPLAGFKSFSLPKSIALDQYLCIKGIGISKMIARVNDGVVEEWDGSEAEKCIQHFKSLL